MNPDDNLDLRIVAESAIPSPSSERGRGVEALLTARLATLRRFVDEVAEEGAMRRRLSTTLAETLAQEASAVQAELWLVPDGVTNMRRQDLEARLANLAASHRLEQVSCWRDLEAVAREHRTWLKEYLELQQRVALVLAPRRTLSEDRQ